MNDLNNKQQEAVTQPINQPVFLLAGAGSGKTKTLTTRLAYVLQNSDILPHNVMVVTFTRKAAHEMFQRTLKTTGLNQTQMGKMFLGTFHSLCRRMLKEQAQQINLNPDFSVIDSDVQLKYVRTFMKDKGWITDEKCIHLNLKQHANPTAAVIYYVNKINNYKENYLFLDELSIHNLFQDELFGEILNHYQGQLGSRNELDFTDLMLKCALMLQENIDILRHYQNKFRLVMVDEFQDTNKLQFYWISLLIGLHQNLFAVGDDDQSIYGFRGSNPENINHLFELLPNIKVIKLEQNYRSTPEIIYCANALIRKNENRQGKTLWTNKKSKGKVTIVESGNADEQGTWIAQTIQSLCNKEAYKYGDMTILYRNNYLSRKLESALIQHQIPYKIHGGLGFFQRKEIKDVINFMRFIFHPEDKSSLFQVINLPYRGVGEKAQQEIEKMLLHFPDKNILELYAENKITKKLSRFVETVSNLRNIIKTDNDLSLPSLQELIVSYFSLMQFYQKYAKTKEEIDSRFENLEELKISFEEFETDYFSDNPQADLVSCFDAYCEMVDNNIVYIEEDKDSQNKVQLMTIHASKGLEFPVVFISDMVQSILPHIKSEEDDRPEKIEEERRLAYVAITRAQEKLFISHYSELIYMNHSRYAPPSQFINELPHEYIVHTQNQIDFFEHRKKNWVRQQENLSFSNNSRIPAYQPKDLSERLKEIVAKHQLK